jgi:hypothetical protein
MPVRGPPRASLDRNVRQRTEERSLNAHNGHRVARRAYVLSSIREKQLSWSVMHYLRWARIRLGRRTTHVTSEQEESVLGAVESAAACEREMGGVDSPGAMPPAPSVRSRIPAAVERSARIRSWRRRVLLRRGALMHAAMGADAEHCSLAMLDEEGIVVSWHGRTDGNDRGADQVVDHHMSQFYVPEDIARKQPMLDLHAAAVLGSDTRQGWQRRPDGIAFWGTTVIDAVLLRDGRLQGFSFLTRDAEGPSAQAPSAQRLELPHDEAEGSSDLGRYGIGILPAWDRMARSRSGARQRRLLRFANRMRMPDGALARPGASQVAAQIKLPAERDAP